MAHEYKPLVKGEQDTEGDELELPEYLPRKSRSKRSWSQCLLITSALLFSNLLSLLGGIYWASWSDSPNHKHENSTLPDYDAVPQGIENGEKIAPQFWWDTIYSDQENQNATDELWEAILPSHGFVAIDRTFAEDNGWPESMYLPSDNSKQVYLLEAYHYLHCLRILRKTLFEAVDGKPYTYHPGAHMYHCFDALRQYVVCNADSTPLYTFGDFTAGDGQRHRCKDWSQLRDYATDNTACYKDTIEHVPLGEHFGHCDDGKDGIIELD